MGEAEAEQIAGRSRERLERALAGAHRRLPEPNAAAAPAGRWRRYRGGPEEQVPETDTAVPRQRLVEFPTRLPTLPAGFEAHRRVARLLQARAAMAQGDRPVDWGTAEALAFAALLADGRPVRLSGQDSQRGTFAHRHAVLHDLRSGREHVPLAAMATGAAFFQAFNSPLSEVGVLGFEFGYSLNCPHGLVLWEAQFGDFSNVAQVIVDQFVTSSEEKWERRSGLCLLLPHGFEGQGPEHSHARPERFLQLAVNDNIQVVNPGSAAQFFHCLRRQALRSWRKPLVGGAPCCGSSWILIGSSGWSRLHKPGMNATMTATISNLT